MKNVLFLTYHMYASKRKGGFHSFFRYFLNKKYDIDVYTIPLHVNWLFKNNDRENCKNFFYLIKGMNYNYENQIIKNFSDPIIFPYRFIKSVKKRDDDLSKYLIPNKNFFGKRLKNNYDYIIIESTSGILLFDYLRERYTNSKIIYRPSDPIVAYTDIKELIEAEKNIIQKSDLTLVINESSLNLYKKYFIDINSNNIKILENPLISKFDILNNNDKKIFITYLGVFPIDYNLIFKISEEFKNEKIYIIGPYEDKIKKDNVIFTGTLSENEYQKILVKTKIAIVPYLNKGNINKLFEITGKIALFMKYNLPIVAINVSQELSKYDIYTCKDYNQFIDILYKLINNKSSLYKKYSSEILMKYNTEVVEKKLFQFLGELNEINQKN